MPYWSFSPFLNQVSYQAPRNWSKKRQLSHSFIGNKAQLLMEVLAWILLHMLRQLYLLGKWSNGTWNG